MRLFASLLLLFVVVSLHAKVAPAPLFQDHAVLQQGRPLPVWGTADAGEKVTVTFAGQTAKATAGTDGSWRVTLTPLKASATPAKLTIAGDNIIAIEDVLVGEVWLCSGQSNMEFLLSQCADADAEIAAAIDPLIRQFRVGKKVSNTPETKVAGDWAVCSPATAGRFTGVGYFFARELHQRLNGVPIGLLNSSWGGTNIESWMSPASLAGPDFAFVDKRWQDALANYPAAKAKYDAEQAEFDQKEAEAKAAGTAYKRPWRRQVPNPDGRPHEDKPAAIYQAMIHPLRPSALAGVLWYQGENNVSRAEQYRQLFPAMITDWRKGFERADLPFYWVQLPNFGGYGKGQIPLLREALASALSLPHTGQAVTIDVGEVNDIHPKNKRDVGLRLALIALQKTYGQKLVASGPVCKSVTFKNGAAEVAFTEIAGGLVVKGEQLTGFELAGEDKKFVPAEARVVGANVIITAATVLAPVAVRYAWQNAPEAALFNTAGLPAAPFRSDTW